MILTALSAKEENWAEKRAKRTRTLALHMEAPDLTPGTTLLPIQVPVDMRPQIVLKQKPWKYSHHNIALSKTTIHFVFNFLQNLFILSLSPNLRGGEESDFIEKKEEIQIHLFLYSHN